MKGMKTMYHVSELTGARKSFFLKVGFFVVLLFFAGGMYLESGLLIDAAYFVIVLALFLKFLIVKLYP